MVLLGIARKFRIPDIIIGLTIVSIGTSMPELFVSLTSSEHGYSDISVGNVVGSNLCNLLLILGITSILNDVKFKKNTKFFEIPFLVLTNLFFFILAQDGIISQKESCLLIFMFIVFLVYTIFSAQKQNNTLKAASPFSLEKSGFQENNFSILKNIFKILIGIIGLKYGGDFVVDNATSLARIFRVSSKIISVTIVAFGTSLPELVTSIIAAFKKKTDLAIGNIIGSNIFNILLIVGISSFIKTIHLTASYNIDIIILYITSFVLFLIPHLGKKEFMTKKEGCLFLATYLIYITKLIQS